MHISWRVLAIACVTACVFIAATAEAATFTMQTGYYVGDGTDNRVISGLGMTPQVIFVKDNSANGDDGMIMRTSSMVGDSSAKLAEAEANDADLVQSLASGQFTIGAEADINTVDEMYYWTAFGGSDCTVSGTLCVGSYTGTGGLGQNISTGFQPDLVIVKQDGAAQGGWTSSAMPANTTARFHAAAPSTGLITALNATSFSVMGAMNTSSATYYFVAFKQVSGNMDVGTYTGNGSDNRNITSANDAGLTFQPDLVWVKSGTTTQQAVWSQTENYGDRSYASTDSAAGSNRIQELRTAGGFQVGTDATVNALGNSYYYAAFNGAVAKNPANETYLMKLGSYTGTGSPFSITNISFTPDLVIIKHNDQATDQHAVFRTSQMGGDNTLAFATGASFTGGITSLNSNGFSVGTHARVNTSGDTYYWTAFGNATRPDKAGGANNFAVGAYIGDGRDNNNITRLPIAPSLLAVKRTSSDSGVWRPAELAGDSSLFFSATAAAADTIQALNVDGFQRGTQGSINAVGNRYQYFAFVESDDFIQNSYTGNGSAQDIAAYNWQPDMVWTKKATGGTARGALLRTSIVDGNASWSFLNQATLSNGFTNLLSDGFSLGSLNEANENTFTYYYGVWDGKKYDQSGFRFFENHDSTSVGAPLAAVNTPATLSTIGQPFRLRALVHMEGGNMLANRGKFRLQVGFGGSFIIDCAAATYADVTNTTPIAFYDNPNATDGAVLTATSTDPTNGLFTIVNQNYLESQSVSFTNGVAAIGDSQDGKWDFSLIDYSADPSAAYCFRIIRGDTVLLEQYSANGGQVYVMTGNSGSHTPTVSNVSIDSGASSITLTEGTTTNVQCTATVTDTDGYSDITSVTAHLHQSSTAVSAPADDNDHYIRSGDAQCVPSGGSVNTENYTCTFAVQYFANPTDDGSPNVLDNWICSVFAYDGTSTSTPAIDTIEMNSLLALDLSPGTIDYSESGALLPEDIYMTIEKMEIVNTGNRDIDPQISGTNMTGDVYAGAIAAGAQKYANNIFDYSTEGTALSTTPTTFDLALPQRTGVLVSDILWWGIQIPLGTLPDTYTGVNTFTAVPGI